MINKQKLPLIIALCIPLLMIILVAGFIYIPGIGKKPKYDFVYLSGSTSYYGTQEYKVSGGKIVKYPITQDKMYAGGIVPNESMPLFYLYSVANQSATELSLEQAQSITLDASNTSPDAYIIERGNGGGGFPFGGNGNYNTWYIKGHNRATKLNLKLTGGDSYYNFQFLGWVK